MFLKHDYLKRKVDICRYTVQLKSRT